MEVPDAADSGDLSAPVAADGAPLVAGESYDAAGASITCTARK